jgi:hypothetical protein
VNYEGEAYLSEKWNTRDRFLIEKAMFVSGGYKTHGKDTYGNGKVYHFKEAMKALIPHFQWHEWADLLVENFIEFDEIGIAGPASAGKTYTMAACAYTYIQCFPTDTTVIISTTTVQALQLRIWGAIKEIHNKAKEIRKWLPGTMLESKCSLVFEKNVDEARDHRDAIIGVAARVGGVWVGISNYCFTAGTKVMTPDGERPIESIKAGELVISAIGPAKVTETIESQAPSLVRVHFSNGKHVDCTPEHPFLTESGWVNAIDLPSNTRLLSPDETMRIVRGATREVPEKFLQLGLSKEDLGKGLHYLREEVLQEGAEDGLLRSILLSEVEVAKSRVCGEDFGLKRLGVDREKGERDDSGQSSREGAKGQNVLQACEHPNQALQFYGEGTNEAGANPFGHVPGGDLELCDRNRGFSEAWNDPSLQDGFGIRGREARRGGGRSQSLKASASCPRCETDGLAGRTRVDRVEVFQSGSIPKAGESEGKHTVYNLQVEGHPSYVVEGVVVHNCGIKNERIVLIADEAHLMERGFLNAVANLRKGSKKAPFKLVAMGNPKDTSDALGTVCEPRVEDGGWEGYDGLASTRTWKTRAKNGIAVQLCGYDTPNGKLKPGQTPYDGIITLEQIENDANYYGKDSIDFTMMNLGIFPRNSIDKRVVTVTLCETSKAFEEVAWESKHTLKRAIGVDAAYSGVGGDRCVMTDLTWGQEANGEIVMAFTCKPIIIPVNPRLKDQPEDQIALFMKEYCDREGISLSSVGIDSTGKGTLVAAIGRLWGTDVIPVEFGGKPTERIVQQRDNKRACDAYGKFVTELWFAARSAIVGRQIRKMPMEVAREGATRAWDYTKGMKQDVEPKEYTKERLGRSPDLFDSFVVALEVARRNGFEIANTQAVGVRVKTRRSNWLMRAVDKAKAAKHELVYQ